MGHEHHELAPNDMSSMTEAAASDVNQILIHNDGGQQQQHDMAPEHHAIHHHTAVGTPLMIDHGMMPMMSIGFVNFPVAFFSIAEPWQFAFLVSACFLISFLVELARARNAVRNLSSKLEKSSSEARKSPAVKRYTPIAEQKLGVAGLRKPSLDGCCVGSKVELTRADVNNNNNNSNNNNESGDDDSKSTANRLKKRRKLRSNNKREHGIARCQSGANKPAFHLSELPLQTGACVRVFQLSYHFIMAFAHYALMMAAMANLWVMIVVCAGAALGYLFGLWLNERDAMRQYKCQTCVSAGKMKPVKHGDDEEAAIPREFAASSSSSDSSGERETPSDVEKMATYYATLPADERSGLAMRQQQTTPPTAPEPFQCH